VKGRFACEPGAGGEAEKTSAERVIVGPLRPKQCRSYARKRLAEALPEIVERFIREAKAGSISHAKALAGMCEFDKAEAGGDTARASRRRGRRNSLTEMLMQELKRGREALAESSIEV